MLMLTLLPLLSSCHCQDCHCEESLAKCDVKKKKKKQALFLVGPTLRVFFIFQNANCTIVHLPTYLLYTHIHSFLGFCLGEKYL